MILMIIFLIFETCIFRCRMHGKSVFDILHGSHSVWFSICKRYYVYAKMTRVVILSGIPDTICILFYAWKRHVEDQG